MNSPVLIPKVRKNVKALRCTCPTCLTKPYAVVPADGPVCNGND